MRLATLPAGLLLLGTTLAAPPGSKIPTTPKGGGSKPGAPEAAGSSPGGNLPVRPAVAGFSKGTGTKQIKLDDVFDVLVDKSKDSCTQYYDPKAEPGKSDKLLNQYWDQVYTFIASGNGAVEDYKSNVEKRKLMQLYFGIEITDKGVSSKGLDGQAFEKVQDWHQKMMSYVTTPQTGVKKPILACGSSFMEFQESSDPMKDSNGKNVKPNLYRFMQDHHLEWYNYWVFWDRLDKSYHVAERDEHQKEAWGSKSDAIPFPEDDDKDIHICNHPEVYANTFGAGEPLRSGASDWEKRTHRKRGTVVLCPQSFKAMTDVTPPITKQKLDTSAHTVGTELAAMGTNALTLYHELFHLVFEPQLIPGKPRIAEDVQRMSANVDQGNKIPADFPTKKAAFYHQDGFAFGPVQCGYVALFDRAEPKVSKLDGFGSVRNPESYAWFGLTSAMHDSDKMDWSSGIAQKPGSAFKGVWTSRDEHRKDMYVPIDTECPPEDGSDLHSRGEDVPRNNTSGDEMASGEDEDFEQEGSTGVYGGSEAESETKEGSKEKRAPGKPGSSKPAPAKKPSGKKKRQLPLRPAGQASSSKSPGGQATQIL